MTHEESEPTFEVQLEAALAYGPIDDVIELLEGRGEYAAVTTAEALQEAIRYYETEADTSRIMNDVVKCREFPHVMGRCLFELEQRDFKRGLEILSLVEMEMARYGYHEQFTEAALFLRRLREDGEDGLDGGAGDREPRLPHDPNDADTIALDPPERSDVTAVGVIDRPSDDEAA